MTIFAAKTDNAVESEFSEPNSLREVLLFCAVLIIEVYSLAVAFGGPFFEVGYFLLVVISQTTAGAYIWAQLRRTDKSLPLPELLAMGFAIGSASAAISQLIIRDLLGIRLFLSPLVPIICVAIWLVAKRNTRLPVTITHANTNTLLWLLFPAPLALMTHSMFLLPLFITPLLLAIYFAKRRQIFQVDPTIKLLMFTLLFFFLTSVIYRISSALTKSEIGIDPYADDLRFDVVQSIASARWGLATSAELANQNLAYYKISFLWLAPITNFNSERLFNLSVTVIPIFLITIVGASLWAVTFSFSKRSAAADIATIVFFVQTSFSGDAAINLRSGWLLASTYLLGAGVFCFDFTDRKKYRYFLMILVIGFVISGTRITFVFFLIALAFVSSASNTNITKKVLILRIKQIAFIAFGAITATTVFTRGRNSTFLSSVFLSASDWPINWGDNLKFVANATTGRILLFLGIILFSEKYRKFFYFTFIASFIFLLTQFTIPRPFVKDSSFIFPYLLVLTPVIAILVADSLLIPKNLLIKTFKISFIVGVIFKICYDSFQRDFEYSNFLKQSVSMVFKSQLLTSLAVFVCCGLISSYFTRLLTEDRFKSFMTCLVIAALTSNCGILIGNQIRPITEYLRYGEQFWGGERDSLLVRWDDQTLLRGLQQTNHLSQADDVVASSFGLYHGNGFSDGIRLQTKIHRRFYISGNFNYYLRSFPLFLKQTYSAESKHQKQISNFSQMLSERFNTSMDFPNYPSQDLLANLLKEDVKWFVVDLGNTQLRDWEPWATTRFMNEKVAILELAQLPAPSN